jgi:hypothetical protein
VAGEILQQALQAVVRDRGAEHGEPTRSFGMIADMWSVYILHVFEKTGRNVLTARDVAQMLTMLKIARATYGDPTKPDHYSDEAGYAALAALFSGVGHVER